MKLISKNKKIAFTLIEMLLVIFIISILVAIVILAINPSKQLAATRNSSRQMDISTISNAVYEYAIDHNSQMPVGIDNNWRVLGSSASGCQIWCGSNGSSALSYLDNSTISFGSGVYNNTQYGSYLELNAAGRTAGTGYFNSGIKDASASSKWQSIYWSPSAPYGKELPSSAQSETAYNSANANMSGNVLLYHLNETSGLVADYSGQNNNGTSVGGVTYNQSGKINNSLGFNGTTSYLSVLNSASLNPVNGVTLEAWVNWSINPSTGQPWANIINKNADNQYQIQHNQTNTRFELAVMTTSGRSYILSNTQPVMGVWYHVVGTWDNTSNQVRIYVNGVLENSSSRSGFLTTSASPINIGRRTTPDRYFNGRLDEVVIYNRALSASEILDHYRRGALRLKLQVRSCADTSCVGQNFIGPDGTAASFYSEANNTSLAPVSFALTNLADNRYFQYRAILETDSSTVSPNFLAVTVNALSTSELTNDNCVDLSSDLSPKYLTAMPIDPSSGTNSQTGYAVKKTDNGRLMIRSCGSELGKIIEIIK
ncbi:MAG: LamG-like jellyroll fold domain-containing protein [Candidatus Falkowbacteria bacterium]